MTEETIEQPKTPDPTENDAREAVLQSPYVLQNTRTFYRVKLISYSKQERDRSPSSPYPIVDIKSTLREEWILPYATDVAFLFNSIRGDYDYTDYTISKLSGSYNVFLVEVHVDGMMEEVAFDFGEGISASQLLYYTNNLRDRSTSLGKNVPSPTSLGVVFGMNTRLINNTIVTAAYSKGSIA